VKPKILIVDDDPLMHLLYRRPLESAGYELLTAKDGEEAMKLTEEHRPQLIIMDVMMPGGDGFSVLRAIRDTEAGRDIPAIIATANVEKYTTVRQQSEIAGAAFISKPISPARLVAEVQRLAPPPSSEPARPGPST
jgi:CheY-like chemotaxis protein